MILIPIRALSMNQVVAEQTQIAEEHEHVVLIPHRENSLPLSWPMQNRAQLWEVKKKAITEVMKHLKL